MKYIVGILFALIAAWLVYQAFSHRRAVIAARARVGHDGSAAQTPAYLESMRLGLAPIYVLTLLLVGLSVAGIWFVVDQERVFSILDIAGFLSALLAYAYWMVVRLSYSTLGLTAPTED